jgi:uncharacterized protein involved in exopolysaccharide biosynthesis
MQAEKQDIREKLEPFRRRWWVIALIVVAIAGLTYHHYQGQHPKYEASATVFVRAPGTTAIAGPDPETDPVRRLANAATLLDSQDVATAVAKKLHYEGDARTLLSQITVTPSADSDFVTVTATSLEPKSAQAIANAFATQFRDRNSQQTSASLAAQVASVKAQLAQLAVTPANGGARANLQTELQSLQLGAAGPPPVQIVEAAAVPTQSVTPGALRNAIFGGVLGLVLACVLIQALEVFDSRLRHPVD